MVAANSKKSRIATVKDKPTFRAWCNYMMLSHEQVSALLGGSTSMVYKNIKGKGPLRPLLCLACNLISEKPAEERVIWIKERLAQEIPDKPWPSEAPITLEEK